MPHVRRIVAMALHRAVVPALLIGLAAASPAAARPTGTFVGQAGGTAIGVVIDDESVQAYVCDGRRVGRWSSVRGARSRVSLGGGAVLLATGQTVRVVLGRRTVRLRRARGDAGLYRSDTRRRGRRELGGWVVLPSGRQVGTVARGGGVERAPRLSTATLVAGSGANQLIAGIVLPPGPQALIADLGGDGLDVGGRVRTSLLGGGEQLVRWTRAGDDDAFVALDANVLRSMGYSLTENGVARSGVVLARGGLAIAGPSGSSTVAADPLHLVRLLDENGDGLLTVADGPAVALLAFRDTNADGRDLDTELERLLREKQDALKAKLQEEQRRQDDVFQILISLSKAAHEVRVGAGVLGL
jgi:hypothetical protein